ncbi:MAG: MoaD/ThiS family protein [Pseudomonadota bacterium]
MSIQVRFFASLREQQGREQTSVAGAADVAAVWAAATDGAEPPANALAAVNMAYADWDSPVADGDEVAFFPPVTGG